MKQIINLSPLFLAVFFFSCSDEQRFVPQPKPTDSDKKQEETTNPSNPSDSNDLSLTDKDSAKDNSVSDKVSTTEETASSEAPAAEEAVSDEIVFDDNIVSSEAPAEEPAEVEPATKTPVAEEASEVESTEAEPAVDASATEGQDDAITFDEVDTITISNNLNVERKVIFKITSIDDGTILREFTDSDKNKTEYSVSKELWSGDEKNIKIEVEVRNSGRELIPNKTITITK